MRTVKKEGELWSQMTGFCVLFPVFKNCVILENVWDYSYFYFKMELFVIYFKIFIQSNMFKRVYLGYYGCIINTQWICYLAYLLKGSNEKQVHFILWNYFKVILKCTIFQMDLIKLHICDDFVILIFTLTLIYKNFNRNMKWIYYLSQSTHCGTFLINWLKRFTLISFISEW